MKVETTLIWGGFAFFIIGLFLLEETKIGFYHPLIMQGAILSSIGYTLKEIKKK